MDINAFSQLGIGIATLAILWLVVKYFIEALTKKDDYIQKVVDSFNLTINNHINHATKSQDSQTRALNKLTKAITELMKEIKNENK